MKTRRMLLALCLLASPLADHMSAAQGSTATLSGVIRDEQNLPAPGATVNVSGVESSLSRSVTTNPDGAFEFPGLLPGEYLVAVELAGFERQQVRVRLEVNQRVRTDVVLRAGGLS